MYWHHHPSAWLRILPSDPKDFRRSALREVVEAHAPLLLPFGEAALARSYPNRRGMVIIGMDNDVPETIATRITQVLHSGEIWGLNSALVTRVRPGLSPTFEIPWPRMKTEFERTLASYLQFAREVLDLSHPLTVVAGLAMVNGAFFVRDKSKWYSNPEKPMRCYESPIRKSWPISSAQRVDESMFEEFYCAVWEACGLDYSREPRVT